MTRLSRNLLALAGSESRPPHRKLMPVKCSYQFRIQVGSACFQSQTLHWLSSCRCLEEVRSFFAALLAPRLIRQALVAVILHNHSDRLGRSDGTYQD